MNINNDERVLNKPEIKQLLHLRSKTPSEMTRHETTQESETFQYFSSRGKRNENLKLGVIGSSKNLFLEPGHVRDSEMVTPYAHYRSNT